MIGVCKLGGGGGGLMVCTCAGRGMERGRGRGKDRERGTKTLRTKQIVDDTGVMDDEEEGTKT